MPVIFATALPVRLAISIALLVWAAPSYGQGFDYQSSADGVLPSAQLATHGGDIPVRSVHIQPEDGRAPTGPYRRARLS